MGAPASTISAAVRAQSAAATAAVKVPGPMRVVVSVVYTPARAEGATGSRNGRSATAWGRGKT